MNKNLTKKIISLLFISIIALNICLVRVYATESNLTINDPAQANTVQYEETAQSRLVQKSNRANSETLEAISDTQPTKVEGSKSVISITRSILGLLQLVGVAVALVMLIVIGIKSILNIDKKTDIKTIVINFIFGCCCIFGATSILLFVQSIVSQIRFA